MDLKGFVEKATDAAKAATEKAREVATTAAEQAKGAMGASAAPGTDPAQAKTLSAIAAEKLAEFKDLGAEKLQSLMTSFQQALPAIQTAGYELTEFEVELGVTPKLIPHFRHAARSAEDIERARESIRGNSLGMLILGALLKAGEVHKQISVAGFAFAHIEIELGIVPSVRLQYKNDSEAPRLAVAALPAPEAQPG